MIDKVLYTLSRDLINYHFVTWLLKEIYSPATLLSYQSSYFAPYLQCPYRCGPLCPYRPCCPSHPTVYYTVRAVSRVTLSHV